MKKGWYRVNCCQSGKRKFKEAAMESKKEAYAVRLTTEERSQLNRRTVQGRIKVRQYKRIQILLLADENHANGGKSDKKIAGQVGVSLATIERTRHRYVEQGFESALNEQPRSGRPKTISGEARAKITALACSTPPEGYGRWSLRLLADKAVELEFIEHISHDAVGDILKKTQSSRI
jgi:transposase